MESRYRIEPPARLRGCLPILTHRTVESCAFFIAAVSIRVDNQIHIPSVELQSAGHAFLKYAILMGARIEIQNHRWEEGRSIGDIDVYSSKRLSDVRILLKDQNLLAGASLALDWMRYQINPAIKLTECAEQAVMECVINKKIKTISGVLSETFMQDCAALKIFIKSVAI